MKFKTYKIQFKLVRSFSVGFVIFSPSLVLTAIGISATWVADKTIGKLIKEKE